MTARTWFFAADGRLRAPWRILLFFAATLFCAIVASVTIVPTISAIFGLARLRVSVEGWLPLAALLAAHAIMLRWVERRPWAEVGLDGEAARPLVLFSGFLLGALAIGIPTALLIGVGWLDRLPATPGAWLPAALRVSLFLLPAAFAEELATRGYVFAVLREVWGWRWTLFVTSAVFGLLHLANAGANVQSVSLVVLAGVFLGAVLLATRSLYAAWMAHFAWNWTMAVIFHTAVSGLPLETPDYRYADAGPDWATGGPWGPEGGAAGGLGMLGGLAYLYVRRPWTRRREEST